MPGRNPLLDGEEQTPGSILRLVRIPLIFTVLVAVLMLGKFFFTYEVPVGSVALIKTLGSLEGATPHDPGLMGRIPGVHSVILYPTRTVAESRKSQPRDCKNQQLTTEISVQLFVKKEMTAELLQRVGDFDALKQKVIDPQIMNATGGTTPAYCPEELLAKRHELVAELDRKLQTAIDAKLTEFGVPKAVTIGQIAVTNFDFSQEFNISVENKVRQEQKSVTATIEKRITGIIADGNGQQTELLATARSEAAKLVNEANAYAIERQGAAAQAVATLGTYEAIQKWDGITSRVTIGAGDNGGGVILNMPPRAATPAPATTNR